MSYFTTIFRSAPKAEQKDPDADLAAFTQSWEHVKETLQRPDERQLSRGIAFTDVPAELRVLVNRLVLESTPDADTTGPCLEYTLKHDVLNSLVRLGSRDRPFGIKPETVKAMLNLVVLMDEHFLVHSTVHKAVLRLLRSCVRDESRSFDGGTRAMGAAGASRGRPSDYEEDLVDLMCALCSRIRLYPQLLLIFFHDKHVYHDLDDDVEGTTGGEGDEEDEAEESFPSTTTSISAIAERSVSPAPSATTITSAPTTSSFYRRPEYEFLVYNYLLRFVHREGKIGDSARTGLLFLMDVAMSAPERPSFSMNTPPPVDPLAEASLAFAEYILESDFADVLAAALGAVYSLLPSKLIVRRPGSKKEPANGAMVLGGLQTTEDESDMDEELERARAFGMDVSTSPEFKGRLAHFVKMVDFIQEVILRQTSPSEDPASSTSSTLGASIAKSILKFLRSSFLANVLYPSILECSDEDGSAVAVITYLEAILSTVKDTQMSEVIISFLTSEDEEDDSKQPATARHKKPRRSTKQQHRQSTAMALLQLETKSRRKSTYYNSLGRFTVKDLLLSNLESKSQPTASAALKLLNTLLTQHGAYALPRIFTLLPISYANGHFMDEDELKTPRPGFLAPQEDLFAPGYSGMSQSTSEEDISALRHQPREMDDADMFRQLVLRLDPKFAAQIQRGGNTQYLQDAQDWLENQLYLTSPFLDPDSDGEQSLSLPERRYRLSPTDPLLARLLSVTQHFFSHSAEMNLSLTGVIHAIACSPQLTLSDWLTYSSNFLASQPAMYTCIASLTAQLPQYRKQAPKFDDYLEQRRRGLLSSTKQDAEALNTPVSLPPSASQSSTTSTLPALASPTTPPKKAPRYSGFVAYFSPSRARAAHEAASHPPDTSTPIHSRVSSGSNDPMERHYRETRAVHLTPLKGKLPEEGPWSPAAKRRALPSHSFHEEEEGGASAWGAHSPEDDESDSDSPPRTPDRTQRNGSSASKQGTVTKDGEEGETTLSEVLDNVVVLEEALKEVAAVLQMRRVMGIDD